VSGRQGGSVGVAFALVLSLVALSVAGYLLYRDVYLSPIDDLSAAVQSVRDESEAGRAQLDARLTAMEATLSRRLDAQQERIGASEATIGRLQLEAAGRKPNELAWRLVESEYLLRLADHRGRLEGDEAGARRLLVAAGEVLAASDDGNLAELRDAVAEGIRLLDGAPHLDVRRVHVELEGIQRDVETLPFRLPAFEGAAADAAADAEGSEDATSVDGQVPDTEADDATASADSGDGAWRRTLGRIGSLFDFRRRDANAPRPILSPDEERFLRMNLALTIEEAQVALTRRDAAMFDASLATVHETIGRFMDTNDGRVVEVRQQVERLRTLDIGAPLPDFSRALTLLQRRMDARTGAAALDDSRGASADEGVSLPPAAVGGIAQDASAAEPASEAAATAPPEPEAPPVASSGDDVP